MRGKLKPAPAAELFVVLSLVDKAVARTLVFAAHGVPFVFQVVASALVPRQIGVCGCSALGRIRIRTLLGAGSIVVFFVKLLLFAELEPFDAGKLALLVALFFVLAVGLAGILARLCTLLAVQLGVFLIGLRLFHCIKLCLLFTDIVAAVFISMTVLHIVLQAGLLFLLN